MPPAVPCRRRSTPKHQRDACSMPIRAALARDPFPVRGWASRVGLAEGLPPRRRANCVSLGSLPRAVDAAEVSKHTRPLFQSALPLPPPPPPLLLPLLVGRRA